MASNPNRDPKSTSSAAWEQRLHEAGTRVEEELRTLISYINDEVVPEVRKNGSVALRKAAQQMETLARKMDERTRPGGGSDSTKSGDR
jgi:hypothetical protein